MILIVSEETDATTDIVCNWLNHFQTPWRRVNKEKMSRYEVTVDFEDNREKILLKTDGGEIDLNDIHKTWFRRGYLQCDYPTPSCPDPKAGNSMRKHLENESRTLEYFLYHILKEKPYINDPPLYNYNKLIALHEARKLGWLTPSTLVCRSGHAIREFTERYPSVITKNIQDILYLHFSDGTFTSQGTTNVKRDDVNENHYGYSLFQNEITKKYELRVFYFLGKMYAAAIFSQLDRKSATDFRNVDVNSHHPNRIVPFQLPEPVRLKIAKLMEVLRLESGSVDIIVDEHNDYYFLEVNPVGQFNFVSQICNYYMERDIACQLSL